jgi:hypothetical protein
MAQHRRLLLVNESSYTTRSIPMDSIRAAINEQLEHFAAAWGDVTWELTRDLDLQGFRIVLLDNADEADALAYHYLTPQGKPYASVFVEDILTNDGTWTDGANSVSCSASHEVVELLADPACNYYADGLDGYMYALEVADPTEGDSYNIDGVAVSNFVHPDYFNPWAKKRRGHKLDHMGLVKKPFETRPGGYVVRHRGLQDKTVWGPELPRWKREMKTTTAHRRTRVRLEELKRLTAGAAKPPPKRRSRKRVGSARSRVG